MHTNLNIAQILGQKMYLVLHGGGGGGGLHVALHSSYFDQNKTKLFFKLKDKFCRLLNKKTQIVSLLLHC